MLLDVTAVHPEHNFQIVYLVLSDVLFVLNAPLQPSTVLYCLYIFLLDNLSTRCAVIRYSAHVRSIELLFTPSTFAYSHDLTPLGFTGMLLIVFNPSLKNQLALIVPDDQALCLTNVVKASLSLR